MNCWCYNRGTNAPATTYRAVRRVREEQEINQEGKMQTAPDYGYIESGVRNVSLVNGRED